MIKSLNAAHAPAALSGASLQDDFAKSKEIYRIADILKSYTEDKIEFEGESPILPVKSAAKIYEKLTESGSKKYEWIRGSTLLKDVNFLGIGWLYVYVNKWAEDLYNNGIRVKSIQEGDTIVNVLAET